MTGLRSEIGQCSPCAQLIDHTNFMKVNLNNIYLFKCHKNGAVQKERVIGG